jgi:hypothetical protein
VVALGRGFVVGMPVVMTAMVTMGAPFGLTRLDQQPLQRSSEGQHSQKRQQAATRSGSNGTCRAIECTSIHEG